jgi:hypothetical protein
MSETGNNETQQNLTSKSSLFCSLSTVASHPELNRIALKQKIDAEYMLWCVLRHVVAENGLSGHFTREAAYNVALTSGLNWSRRNFNRIIAAGGGLFWGTDTERIYMRSFKWVYNNLADKQAASVPSSQFVMIQPNKSVVNRRAELYWSWFAARTEQTIARDTITDLFGLSHDQQRAYEAALGSRLLVKTNYCHIDADLYKNNLKNLPPHAYHFIHEKLTDNRVEYVNVIAYQLPNTYIARGLKHGESPLIFAPKRALSVTRRHHGHTTARDYNERCYYDFYDQWEKHMNPKAFVRTWFQGSKRVYRQGQYW